MVGMNPRELVIWGLLLVGVVLFLHGLRVRGCLGSVLWFGVGVMVVWWLAIHGILPAWRG